MENKIAVWTHGGKFHADEISAIALLSLFHPGFIENGYTYVREFNNPLTNPKSEYWEFGCGDEDEEVTLIAVDIGREFDGVTKFDHHHDPKLEAACVLIGEWLVKEGYLQERVWKELYMNLFKYISDVDTGKIPGGGDSYGFNAIIRNLQCSTKTISCPSDSLMNRDNIDFHDVLHSVVLPIIAGYHTNIVAMFEEDDNWPTFIKRDGIVEMGLKKCRRWKMFAKDEDVRFAVARNDRDPKEGIVLTYCQNKYPIVEDLSQTFLHNSKFFASYKTYEDAKRHAVEMAKMYKEKLELI